MGIQVVEEGVLRIFLPWIGIREHSLYAHRVELLTESGQSDLLRIVEPVRHVGRTATRSADRLIRRIEIEERPLRSIRQALPVIPVEDLHALKQPAVGHDQLPIQQVRTLSVAETHAKLPLAVDRIDSVITGAHQKDEQCGPHQVVQSSRIVPGTLLEEVFLTRLVSRQITIIALQGQKRPDQLLRPVADHAVNIDQVLVRVVNDTPHLREVLPDSEEEGAASDKRFDIGFHPGEIRRQRFAQDGQQAALAVIAARHGSTPREIGAKMLVRTDGSIVGSVGGGIMEHRTILAAQEMLTGAAPAYQRLHFSADGKNDDAAIAACGGSMEIVLTRLQPGEEIK